LIHDAGGQPAMPVLAGSDPACDAGVGAVAAFPGTGSGAAGVGGYRLVAGPLRSSRASSWATRWGRSRRKITRIPAGQAVTLSMPVIPVTSAPLLQPP